MFNLGKKILCKTFNQGSGNFLLLKNNASKSTSLNVFHIVTVFSLGRL